MTDGAGRIRPENSTKTPWAGNSKPQKKQPQGSVEGWVPSRARRSPPRQEVDLAALFDRLATAAAAHDGEVPMGIFGEPG